MGPMRLWIVEDCDRWGFSNNLVRAETREQACELVDCDSSSTTSRRTLATATEKH